MLLPTVISLCLADFERTGRTNLLDSIQVKGVRVEEAMGLGGSRVRNGVVDPAMGTVCCLEETQKVGVGCHVGPQEMGGTTKIGLCLERLFQLYPLLLSKVSKVNMGSSLGCEADRGSSNPLRAPFFATLVSYRHGVKSSAPVKTTIFPPRRAQASSENCNSAIVDISPSHYTDTSQSSKNCKGGTG